MKIDDTIASMNPEIQQNNIELETKPKENFFKEIIKFTILALAIVIPVRTFIAQPFIVSGPSMNPTFATGQYLIVDQLSYYFKNPQRHDVVVFKYPNNPKVFYIKRIIALPNETMNISEGKVTIINKENPEGILLDDSYIERNHRTGETMTKVMGPTEYFVMGDNRSESSDSRLWGVLDEKYIIGRPFLRLLPLTNISVFPGEINI